MPNGILVLTLYARVSDDKDKVQNIWQYKEYNVLEESKETHIQWAPMVCIYQACYSPIYTFVTTFLFFYIFIGV